MPSQSDILASQIERLMLSKDERKRLLEELKAADPAKLNLLADLIGQHDEEALKILNEKSTEQREVKSQLNALRPEGSGSVKKEEVLNMVGALEAIFKDPKALAEFILASDDVFLMELENIFEKNLQKDPNVKAEFMRFFSEMRLSKNAMTQEEKIEDRERLMNEIVTNERNAKQLDELIAQAEKVLNNK